KVIETVKTSLDPKDPVGSTPDALALSPDGRRLYVANADNNNVAVVDVADARESRVLGFIPTGWNPSSMAVSNDGRKLFVGTGKGLRFRGNYPAQVDASLVSVSPNPKTPYDYIGRVLGGAVSVVDVPDKAQLEAYTRQVRANTPRADDLVAQADAALIQKEVFSKIKHVVYIIRENRTYDQVFGDLGVGNGDPNLTLFGESVTPNAHQLARQTVVLDNLYCNGEVSEDGHQWCNGAYATDFTERAWPSSYSKRGGPQADERLPASPGGFLGDNCARHGLTYRSYGEFASFTSSPEGAPKFTGDKGLEGHACAEWDKVKHNKDARDTNKAEV